jgi:DNA-binding CsgD family transcriptional regulator
MNEPTALGHALNRLGNWYANHDEIDEALRHHDEALAIFTRLDDRRGLAETLDLLAMALSLGGDLDAAQEAARRALTLFSELGDRQGLAGVLILTHMPAAVFEIATLAGGSTIAESIGPAEQALAIAREIDWRSGESFLLALLGEVQAVRGEFGPAIAFLEESIRIAEEIDHRQWLVQARWGLARLFGTMLLPARERAELERALSLARDVGSPLWVSTAIAALASTYVSAGETMTAASLLAEVMSDATPLRTQSQRLLWAARTELALANGQPQEALAIVDRLYSSARNVTSEGDVPWLAQLKAAALTALGDLPQAETLLAAAQSLAHDQGALPRLRLLCLDRAEVLRMLGRDEAQNEEAAAQEIAARLAMTIPDGELRDEFALAAGLVTAGDATPARRATKGAAGLTPREREVAAQIAAGRSNREIAAALFVSERTVEAHVANILRKLDTRSRAGIAAWAERQQLTPAAT